MVSLHYPPAMSLTWWKQTSWTAKLRHPVIMTMVPATGTFLFILNSALLSRWSTLLRHKRTDEQIVHTTIPLTPHTKGDDAQQGVMRNRAHLFLELSCWYFSSFPILFPPQPSHLEFLMVEALEETCAMNFSRFAAV